LISNGLSPYPYFINGGIDPHIEGACHETNVSAEQNKTGQDPWVPEEDVHEAGQEGH
jgi:hypothetical protein